MLGDTLERPFSIKGRVSSGKREKAILLHKGRWG